MMWWTFTSYFSMYSEVSYKREDMMVISEANQGTAHIIPSSLLQFDGSQTNNETFITPPPPFIVSLGT